LSSANAELRLEQQVMVGAMDLMRHQMRAIDKLLPDRTLPTES
jgi:hypothetical protein